VLPVFRFPQPGGPYDIGTVTYHWIDTSRPEIFTSDLAARRELMVQIWYPARADPAFPRAPDDYAGHTRLAAMSSIPIATGENEYTRYGFRDLIKTGAVPILNADAKILGGVTEWVKVAALAQAHNLVIAPHGSQDIHIHLVSSISNGLLLEFHRASTNPMWAKMYHHPLLLNDDGTVSPPEVPGTGIEPNYEVLEPFRIA